MTYSPLTITKDTEVFGFSTNRSGGHLSRSMMLPEITTLTELLPPDASGPDYPDAVIDKNVLGKPTASSQEKSLRHLIALYGLDPKYALFRVLRQLVADDPESTPLIGMVCTFCRDIQLRASFSLVDQLSVGEVLSRERMESHLEDAFPGRYGPAMRKSLAQNVNTTWTVSGHLTGRSVKVRSIPEPRMAASVYAMFAGYLLGLRGEILLQSVFGRLVAQDRTVLVSHLTTASGRGLLRFRHAGGVTEIDFEPLLNHDERQVIHESH